MATMSSAHPTVLMAASMMTRYPSSVTSIGRTDRPSRCARRSNHTPRRNSGSPKIYRLSFGTHYAETLRQWEARFLAHHDAVLALGFDETFVRMWHFYLGRFLGPGSAPATSTCLC